MEFVDKNKLNIQKDFTEQVESKKDTNLPNDQINYNKHLIEEFETSVIDSLLLNKNNELENPTLKKENIKCNEKDESEEDWNLVDKEDM